ncbi:MAG: hypothetical protein M3N21_05340 [Actinomycetota bacterium]|nr:hypothetical protein [Actinomycetota bacterium]
MTTRRQSTCAFCGSAFTPGPDARTTPLYCCRSHRQRAYEIRQRDAQLAELISRLRDARGDIRWLRRVLTEHGIDPGG